MPQHQWSSAAHRSSTPDVPRPSADTWQTLESERIRWEGQVLIVGQDSDLPALLVITGKRLGLIANGEIALEFPLGWMRPEPKLTAENGIRLFISPDGNSQVSQPMLLRAKAGRGAAAEIAAVLTGRTFNSRATDSPMHIPAWNDRAGAGPSVALPHLKDDAASTAPRPKAAWPPAETTGVSSTKKAAASTTPKPSAGIAPWRVGSDVPRPAPVPTDASRAARVLGTSRDGFTVSDAPNPVRGNALPADPQRKHRFPMWLLNLTVIALLLAGFGYVAADRGYGFDNMRSMVPSNVASFVGIDRPTEQAEVAEAPGQAEPAPTQPTITEGGDNTLNTVENSTVPTETPTQVVAVSTEAINSIGGSNGQLPITASVLGTPDATEEATETEVATEVVVETEVATEAPVETEVATEVATEAPIETVVATEEPVETEVATEAPVETEVATEAPVETEIATEAPTEVATEEVVETPEPTEVATEVVEATVDPTVLQPTETPVPTAAPTQTVVLQQPASVAEGEVPTQEFQQGGIRYSIDAVATGSSIDGLPQINNIGQTWVILTLTGANTSSTDQQFAMSNFTLLADGNPVPLDTGTGWVSSLLGNEPAYGNTDAATWAQGEQHQFTLTFLAPPNVTSLTLVTGDQQIALDPAIASSVSLTDIARDEAPAATVSGTVVDAVDAQTIVVDVDGEQITVRYLGIDAPVGDACYAAEATAANAELVEGQTVTLERQSVDTTARGLWVRDVWVTDANGSQVLVSQALVSQGAATSKVSEPNSRYAGWLGSTEQGAQQSGAGLWEACGN